MTGSPLDRLDGARLKRMLVHAAHHLQANKQQVDALNVFPVPDGDTGTNMSMTMSAALRELEQVDSDSAAEVAQAAAQGSLMGARGNSGVILSQLYRGFARHVEGRSSLSPVEFALGLEEGVRTAYKAVMKPVEGTILTVARESARAAVEAARSGYDLVGVLRVCLAKAEQTLERTPDMLPVLKRAGVVDSGGKGLCFILSAYLAVLEEAAPPSPQAGQFASPADRPIEKGAAPMAQARSDQPTLAGATRRPDPEKVAFQVDEEISNIQFPYDIEFFIRQPRVDDEAVRGKLESFCAQGRGDSLIVIGGRDRIKVHVHADNPGPVLDYAARQGELVDIQIKNMREQHEALFEPEAPAPAGGHDRAGQLVGEAGFEPELDDPKPRSAMVAVAMGEGLAEIFRSLGVSVVVHGGQTMNPSTQDLLEAIEATGADEVILLPNNKNVILCARQCAELSPSKVHVVPSRSVPQGLAAALRWSPDRTPDQVVLAMENALETVRTGEVTFAVRNTRLGDFSIEEGDILGLADGELKVVGASPEDVVVSLLPHLVWPESAVVTVYAGEAVAEATASELAGRIRAAYPEHEVEVYPGRQPLYHYIVSVE